MALRRTCSRSCGWRDSCLRACFITMKQEKFKICVAEFSVATIQWFDAVWVDSVDIWAVGSTRENWRQYSLYDDVFTSLFLFRTSNNDQFMHLDYRLSVTLHEYWLSSLLTSLNTTTLWTKFDSLDTLGYEYPQRSLALITIVWQVNAGLSSFKWFNAIPAI